MNRSRPAHQGVVPRQSHNVSATCWVKELLLLNPDAIHPHGYTEAANGPPCSLEKT